MQTEHLRFLCVGDVMLGRLVNRNLQSHPPEYPWGDTLPLFQEADWRLCNLECVISDLGAPWSITPKVFHFRSDAKNVAVLRAAKVNAVSLANNHTLDFDCEAMFQMLELLSQAGIRHSGAGRNADAAAAPAFAEVKGARIGMISFTDNEPPWEAKADGPGICFVPIDLTDPRARRLLEHVRRTKEKVDLVIVAAHWGPNWDYAPPPTHQAFGRALIDAGADIVVGHSAHIMRGIECYRERLILYSLGDFIDDYAVDRIERNDQSGIFILEIGGFKIRGLRVYPTVIRDFQARLAREVEAGEIAGLLLRLCHGFGTEASWNPHQRFLEIRTA